MILGMDLIVGVTTHMDGMVTMATGAGTTTIGTRAVIVATKTIAVPSWLACSVENGGGNFDYSYINEDGNSRTTESYYTTMKFFQYNQNSNSYSGEGVETDYLMDDDGNPIDDANHKQVMEFSWYIESNGDIYIQYKTSSKSTFVLDYGSSQRGYFIGQEDDKNYDTFYGYMIGTGNVNGDVIKFDFARLNEASNAKALTRSAAGEVESYGKGATQKPLKSVPATRFNSRR